MKRLRRIIAVFLLILAVMLASYLYFTGSRLSADNGKSITSEVRYEKN